VTAPTAHGLEPIKSRLRLAGDRVGEGSLVRRVGEVVRAAGAAVESRGPLVSIGEEVRIESARGDLLSLGEVIGFEGSRVFVMPIDHLRGVSHGDKIVATERQPAIPVGDGLLGRVLDATGRPLDGLAPPVATTVQPIYAPPVAALERPRIHEPMATGVRAIDGMLTIGRGQRIGIFAGAGVGKSKLLGGIARHAADDVIVIALVGERNREVREFIEGELGSRGLARAVVFVATSDESPLRRVRCALAATTAAEAFRRDGKHVTLLMDSLTRVAMGLREIGLAAGEPPTSKGYTPSVFSFLPRLLERAGCQGDSGSITGIYTVFVEGDDLSDPVADASRAILDGHVVLSRRLAERSHYPAIDVLASTSRVMPQVVSKAHMDRAHRIRRMMAIYRDNEDLIAIGAYRGGSDKELDRAVDARSRIETFLCQDFDDPSSFEQTEAGMIAAEGASPASEEDEVLNA